MEKNVGRGQQDSNSNRWKEGQHADHLTTTMAQIKSCFSNKLKCLLDAYC